MTLNLLSMYKARFVTYLMSALMLIIMSACGGGNGPPGDPLGDNGGGVNTAKIEFSFSPASGQIQNGFPLILQATLLDQNGNVVPNELITFTLPSGTTTAIFPSFDPNADPLVGQSATDAGGVAQVVVVHGATAGAVPITATSTFNDNGVDVTAKGTIAFTAL